MIPNKQKDQIFNLKVLIPNKHIHFIINQKVIVRTEIGFDPIGGGF